MAKEGIEAFLQCYEKTCEIIKKLTKRVKELARNDADIKRLIKIPGIEAIAAVFFKTEAGDLK
jgi:transposase